MKLSKICVLDTETQGLNIEKDNVIEIAASLIDVELGLIVKTFSTLIYADGGVSPEAFDINNIPTSAIEADYAKKASLDPLLEILSFSQAICAHNASFDQPFVEKLFKNYNIEFPKLPWIDTLTRIKFAKMKKSMVLTHLATDNGIVVGTAHRALQDVLLLSELLIKAPSLGSQLFNALTPFFFCYADVSFEDRNKAKDLDFRWIKAIGKWVKYMSEDERLVLNEKFRCLKLTAEDMTVLKKQNINLTNFNNFR